MKAPISYYGGKQNLVKIILPLFPKHTLYAEPFIGGGAIFWSKRPSQIEVINDTNRELINFYEVIKNDFATLSTMIRISLHSRSQFNDAKVVYSNPHMFSREKRAWAIWVMANQSFSSMIDGTWGYDISKNCTSKKINNKRNEFSEELAIRLQNVQIECTDALRIINSRDQKDAFFYCDPPYFNSDCGHYDGYSKEDFKALLTLLSSIKGKFLLSSYPSDILSEYTEKHGWYQKQIKQTVSVANNNSTAKPNKSKIEVLTANYNFEALHKPTDLFTDL